MATLYRRYAAGVRSYGAELATRLEAVDIRVTMVTSRSPAAARSAALAVFLGGIVLLFVLIAAVLVFWRVTDQPTRADQREDSSAVGTTGEPRSTEEETRRLRSDAPVRQREGGDRRSRRGRKVIRNEPG